MMTDLPTMLVYLKSNPQGDLVKINVADFDESVHIKEGRSPTKQQTGARSRRASKAKATVET